MVVRFGIAWRAPCRRLASVHPRDKMLPAFDALTRDHFVDTDGYRERFENGIRAILNARVAGAASRAALARHLRIRIRVFSGSRLVDRCYPHALARDARN